MSDDSTAPKLDTDPAARVANELRARLRSLPPGELVEMCAQLVTTYVLESVLPLSRAGDSTDLAADQGGEESFAQLLKRLKSQKRDPTLDRFIIDGENISVRIDGQGVLPLTEYRRPTQAPSAPASPASPGVTVQTQTVRQPSVHGAATSIYNRSRAARPARFGPAEERRRQGPLHADRARLISASGPSASAAAGDPGLRASARRRASPAPTRAGG
jgi:hypothetical protein